MGGVTGLPPTRWARSEEYDIPFYKEITQEMIEIHAETGGRQRDPSGGHQFASLYIDGLYWSRQWEYPWAIESAELVDSTGYCAIDDIEDMKVLDVGCGSAPFLIYLGQMGCRAYGSDPGSTSDQESIDGFWSVFNPDFGKPYITELRQEGMQELSWSDDYFDRVFCLSVIEHLPLEIVQAGIGHMKRILKPDGLLVMSVDSGLMKEEIIRAAAMPFHGGTDLGEAPYTDPPHVYPILGMVFRKESCQQSQS